MPQGSILGPLLFVLFISDISLGISPGTKTCLFADDTKIWQTMHSELDCKMLQNDIDNLNKWCKANKMLFHPEKCKVVSIVSNANRLTHINLLPFSKFSYTLGSSVLNYEENEVDLGVIINDRFTWSDHQNKIILKASQMLGLTKHTCHFLMVLPRNYHSSELPLIGITNFWNYHSLMLVIAMLVIPRFLIGISTS